RAHGASMRAVEDPCLVRKGGCAAVQRGERATASTPSRAYRVIGELAPEKPSPHAHGFRMQLSPVVMIVPRFTTSKSVTWMALRALGSTFTLASLHLAVVYLSSAAVRAMLPPSERNMPYFCMALATVRAPSLGSLVRSKEALRRKWTP